MKPNRKEEVVFIEKKGYYIKSIDGNICLCVCCKKPLEHSLTTLLNMHHCNHKDIHKRDTIHEGDRDVVYDRSRGHNVSWANRLKEGLDMTKTGNAT